MCTFMQQVSKQSWKLHSFCHTCSYTKAESMTRSKRNAFTIRIWCFAQYCLLVYSTAWQCWYKQPLFDTSIHCFYTLSFNTSVHLYWTCFIWLHSPAASPKMFKVAARLAKSSVPTDSQCLHVKEEHSLRSHTTAICRASRGSSLEDDNAAKCYKLGACSILQYYASNCNVSKLILPLVS